MTGADLKNVSKTLLIIEHLFGIMQASDLS